MGRGRAPCCAKIGLNKGSWTPEEDIRLIAYIQKHGHANWRALPKYAGLLRCGKSCRLRWINYLRPDIKRGNFTMEEEETIIKLHNLLGNKWSKIAACLPGRTDNEIKNVWNTHLKKRLASRESPTSSSSVSCSSSSYSSNVSQDVGQGPGQTPGDIAQEEALEIPEIEIEPEIWSMIDSSSELWEEKESNKNSESREWLDYLEKELGLWEAAGEEEEEEEEDKQDGVEMDGVDPVASYFQKGPSNIYN